MHLTPLRRRAAAAALAAGLTAGAGALAAPASAAPGLPGHVTVATVANLTPPTITGTAEVGRTVTADPGTWDVPGATFTYQWLSDGVEIDGATAASYTIVPAVSGDPLTVEVTATGTDGTSATATSAAVDVPAVAPSIDRWNPSISWGATEISVEQEAVIEPGGWDVPDATFTYQWQLDGADLPGETGPTFTPPFEYLHHTMTAVVVAWNHGVPSEPFTTAPVTVGPGSVPFDTPPSISGQPKVGSTLTLDPGTWHHDGVTATYQWMVDYENVPGATGLTYTVRAADVGKVVSALVTLTKPDYLPDWGFTDAVTVEKGDLTSTAAPVVTGTPRVGSTLHVTPGTWSATDGVTRHYQWTADGTPVAGATGSTFTLPASVVGKSIAVVETAGGPGYNPAEPQTSAPVVARKATSRTALRLTSPRKGKVKAVVTVTADVKATGKVAITVDGATHRVALVGGKASLTVGGLDGRVKVTAAYPGSTAVAGSRDSGYVRVR